MVVVVRGGGVEVSGDSSCCDVLSDRFEWFETQIDTDSDRHRQTQIHAV